MKILIALGIFLGIIGLIFTVIAVNSTDTNYNSQKSFSNLSMIYLITIPVAIIGGIILWIIL
ncbi:hypothetical protein [Paucisalibacillus globulus]|uniref:hypothetical protein n=1 Tax=Paucisalibacillus globulus TaxID=351095 RepID=UPI00040BF8F4|nr:hypothetical protein [Paucisalibacillus globulus]